MYSSSLDHIQVDEVTIHIDTQDIRENFTIRISIYTHIPNILK
jgi:hypothetical protein